MAELSLPPGNIAVTATGRLLFNIHPEYSHSSGTKIAECRIPNQGLPPTCTDKTWKRHPATDVVDTVLSLRVDRQDRLWLLDFGNHATTSRPALVRFDLGSKPGSDKFISRHQFDKKMAPFGSMLNDFAVSPSGEHIYIADTSIVGGIIGTSRPSLLVYHVPTGSTHRLLSGHPSTLADKSVFVTVKDEAGQWPQRLGPFAMRIGVDSITLDRRGKYLYYGPVSGRKLYRIDTAYLNAPDPAGYEELSNYVEEYADKPVSDGITIDFQGNIYVTDIEHSAISRIEATDRSIRLVAQDKHLFRWPDGFSFGPGAYLYFTNSGLHRKFGGANMKAGAPYYINRIKVPVGAPSGH